MRLGADPVKLHEGTRAREIFGEAVIYKRHRHRYEVNNMLRRRLEDEGLICSGTSPDERLVELIELPDHPFFVASQFHPEFNSRPNRPEPLFRDFIGASAEHAGQRPEAEAEAGEPAEVAESETAPADRRRRARYCPRERFPRTGDPQPLRDLERRGPGGRAPGQPRGLGAALGDHELDLSRPRGNPAVDGRDRRAVRRLAARAAGDSRARGRRLLALGRVRAHGRASGLELDQPIGWLIEFRGEKLAETWFYLGHDEALGAAGLG
jgi:hypothetical protein